ncbi:MAG: 5,10-methylenetetrahydrofolate reductase [Proteobacteria bacterium]|nr:5,10-methylenetetrahydrofolate reductase [Pseudomonadota bacterium]NIS69254.1 5,10-methylenetetrahydrofolate reductase [Pseudomonadota bacterium]
MKVTEIWKTRDKPTISFELFPPRDEPAAEKLEKVIEELAVLRPDFVSVTFGAGGSTREGSYNLVKKLLREKGLETLAYFTCHGLGPEDITSVLDSYRDLGVENVLAARGDPPHQRPDFKPHPVSLPHASDLLAFIRPRYDFCLGAAGYPEGHIEATSKERDLEYLKLKVEKGADFIITNYFYDNRYFFDFLERCHRLDIQVPILPGVMPIYSVKMMENLAKLCGATITSEIRDGLAGLPEGDKEAITHFGIDFAISQCKGLLETGVPGLHIYTMDRAKSAVEIVNHLREAKLLG